MRKPILFLIAIAISSFVFSQESVLKNIARENLKIKQSQSVAQTISNKNIQSCGNAGFNNIQAASPYHCNDTIWLTAWDSLAAGGYISPAWEFTVVTDQYDENWFNAYENSVLFYSHNPDENVTQSYYGGYMDPTAIYTAEWCDSYGDGSFDWSITDLSNDNVLYSGTWTYSSANECHSQDFTLGGTYEFHSDATAGFYDFGNGQAAFVCSEAGPGTYNFYYQFSNSDGSCSGTSATQTITVVGPTASAGNTQTTCAGVPVTIGGSPTASGGVSGYTYAWSPASGLSSTSVANPTSTITTTTTYTVTVTDVDGNGCEDVSTVTINVNPLPTISVTSNSPICDGDDINLYETGNEATSWNWTGPNSFASTDHDPVISGAGLAYDGTYYVTITDANTCTNTANLSVTVNPQPTADAGSDASICEGGTYSLSGSITNATEYHWSHNGTGSLANDNTSTPTYTPGSGETGYVTITLSTEDVSGPCGAAVNDMVLTITPLDDASFSYDNGGTFCATGADPSPISIATPGGTFSSTSGLVINSSTGEIDLSASTLGNYVVTYLTNGTCPNTEVFNVSLTAGFDAEFYYDTPVCNSGTNPMPQHNTGTNGVYSGLNFVNTGTGEIDFANNAPGSYTITNTIAASGGCAQAQATYDIVIDDAATVFAGNDTVICASNLGLVLSNATMGGSATSVTWATNGDGSFVDGSVLNAEYNVGSADITNNTVTLTVTTNDPGTSCSAVNDDIIVTVNEPAIVNAGNNDSICAGNTYTLNGTISGSATSPQWAAIGGDGVFDDNTILSPTYTPGTIDISNGFVDIYLYSNDPFGPCDIAYDTMRLTINPLPIIDSVVVDNVLCNGGNTGQIVIYSGTATDYSIDGGINTSANNTFTGLVVDTFAIWIGDVNGCTSYSSAIVDEPTQLVLDSTISAAICGSTGTAQVGVSGGTSPYSYVWNTSDTTNTIDSLAAGTYICTVTDINGCSTSINAVVPNGGLIPDLQVYNVNDVLCFGESTGSVTANLNNNNTPFTYSWSHSNLNDSTATNLSAGTYYVTIYDSFGCYDSDTIVISQPSSSLVSSFTSVSNPKCYNDSTGAITVTANGGTPKYTYLWSNGETSETVNNLQSGNYSVTISDNNGCTNTIDTILDNPSQILISDSVYYVNYYGNIQVEAVGGTPSYTYQWSNGVNDKLNQNLTSGDYYVTITDAENCKVTSYYKVEIDLIIPTVITPNGDGKNDSFRITNIEDKKSITINIFNRWGDLIYNYDGSGEGYPAKEWGGTDLNGHDLPMGSYVYVIEIDGVPEPPKGTVTIVR